MVLFYRFHAPFFFIVRNFALLQNSRRSLAISAKGKLKKVVKFSPEKQALPIVMKSPDLDNRWQRVAWLKQDTENFLFSYVTCNQTRLNPLMDHSKCGNVTKLKQKKHCSENSDHWNISKVHPAGDHKCEVDGFWRGIGFGNEGKDRRREGAWKVQVPRCATGRESKSWSTTTCKLQRVWRKVHWNWRSVTCLGYATPSFYFILTFFYASFLMLGLTHFMKVLNCSTASSIFQCIQSLFCLKIPCQRFSFGAKFRTCGKEVVKFSPKAQGYCNEVERFWQ